MSELNPVPPESPVSPLRVALFTDNYGPGPSGIVYAVQFIEAELARQGHRCLVVAPRCDGPNPHAGAPGRSEMRLPSARIPSVPARLATGRGFERALDDLARNPPDVFHSHGLGSVGLLGYWAAQRANKPFVVTWHTDFEAYAEHYASLTPFLDAYVRLLKVGVDGLDRAMVTSALRHLRGSLRHPRAVSRLALIGVAAEMLEAAALVTTPSDKTAQRVIEIAPRANVRVSPNGADALPDAPLGGLQPPAKTGRRIAYVGRIAPEKGIPLLLDAFEWVREEIPDAELMIVGEWRDAPPTLRRMLTRAARRGGVNLVGMVPRDQLGPFYASADVFAFPSTTDTQALVLHEAAHAGLPIVSADPELHLVIDDGVNGALARPTPAALGRALVRVLRQLDDPAFAARAHARSREMASWWSIDHQSREMVGFYEDVAAGRRVAPSLVARPYGH